MFGAYFSLHYSQRTTLSLYFLYWRDLLRLQPGHVYTNGNVYNVISGDSIDTFPFLMTFSSRMSCAKYSTLGGLTTKRIMGYYLTRHKGDIEIWLYRISFAHNKFVFIQHSVDKSTLWYHYGQYPTKTVDQRERIIDGSLVLYCTVYPVQSHKILLCFAAELGSRCCHVTSRFTAHCQQEKSPVLGKWTQTCLVRYCSH